MLIGTLCFSRAVSFDMEVKAESFQLLCIEKGFSSIMSALIRICLCYFALKCFDCIQQLSIRIRRGLLFGLCFNNRDRGYAFLIEVKSTAYSFSKGADCSEGQCREMHFHESLQWVRQPSHELIHDELFVTFAEIIGSGKSCTFVCQCKCSECLTWSSILNPEIDKHVLIKFA